MKPLNARLLASGFGLAAPLFAGLAVVPSIARQPLATILPEWRNVHLLFVALSVACLGCALLISRRREDRTPIEIGLRLVLVTSCSLTGVLLFKYLVGMIPDTWTAEVIHLYGITGGSIADLYSTTSIREPPLLMPIYPPGYYMVLRPLLALFGGGPLGARILSTASVLAVAVALGVAARGLDRRRWFLAPALFLALFPVLTWSGPPTKPEYLAAAFATLAFAVYIRRGFGHGGRWVWWSGLLFGAGFLTKYTIIGAFATVVMHLVVRRRVGDALTLIAVSFGFFFLVYAILWVPTDGGVWLFTVSANAAALLPSKIVSFGILEFLPRAFTTLVLAASIVAIVRGGAWADPRTSVAVAPLVALMLFLLATGRPGSSANYFLEFVVLGALLLAGGLSTATSTGEAPEETRSGAGDGTSMALLTALLLTQLPNQAALLSRSYGQASELQAETVRLLEGLPVQEDEFVLSDAEYVYELLAAGQRPLVYDAFMFTLMAENGTAQLAPMMTELTGGRVPFLVLANHLDAYASAPYGARDLPLEVVEYARERYACREHLRQWDGIPLVICSLRARP